MNAGSAAAAATVDVPLQKTGGNRAKWLWWKDCDSDQLERSKQRVVELENTHKIKISLPILQNQTAAILDVRHQVYHGPNTIDTISPSNPSSVSCKIILQMSFSCSCWARSVIGRVKVTQSKNWDHSALLKNRGGWLWVQHLLQELQRGKNVTLGGV